MKIKTSSQQEFPRITIASQFNISHRLLNPNCPTASDKPGTLYKRNYRISTYELIVDSSHVAGIFLFLFALLITVMSLLFMSFSRLLAR